MSGARGTWRPVQDSTNAGRVRGKWRLSKSNEKSEAILRCTLCRGGWRAPEANVRAAEVKQ
jgi:hypothetical protein